MSAGIRRPADAYQDDRTPADLVLEHFTAIRSCVTTEADALKTTSHPSAARRRKSLSVKNCMDS
jgi:hypothetical protein